MTKPDLLADQLSFDTVEDDTTGGSGAISTGVVTVDVEP